MYVAHYVKNRLFFGVFSIERIILADESKLGDMRVIFLDIDGVIQPLGRQERFEHLNEIEEISKTLNQKIPGFNYYEYVTEEVFPDSYQGAYSRKCNLAAVLFDWPKDAVKYLGEVLERQNAKIVISSDWRDFGSCTIKAFLAVWGLDKYFYGMLDGLSFKEPTEGQIRARKHFAEKFGRYTFDERAADIRDYLDSHLEITSYVAVDDRCLGAPVENHFVFFNDGKVIDERRARQMDEILSIEDGPYPLDM